MAVKHSIERETDPKLDVIKTRYIQGDKWLCLQCRFVKKCAEPNALLP